MTSKDTATKRAVIYARISKDKTGAGVGVGKQESDCRELAARLGFDVTGVRTDNDLTAFKGGARSKPRPGYKDLLADLRASRAEVVLAWHTDRLHRDMTELEEYIQVCGEGSDGVPTYTVKGGELHLDTASGRMVARILGAVARQEVEHMIERQKSATKRLREAGAWKGGQRPFGYRPDGPSVKNGGEGRLAQVPEEAAAIRKAYEDVLAGVTIYAVVRSWNEAGLTTSAKRNPWDTVHVRRVLLRALNAGLVETDARDEHGLFPQAPQIVGHGRWEPIVSEDTWRAVRAILVNADRRTSQPGPKSRHLLTGVLICGRCGSRKFQVHTPGANGKRSYICARSYTAPGVPDRPRCALARDVALLDAYAESIIIERLSRPDVVAALNTRPEVDIAALDRRRTAIGAELEEWARTPGITPRQMQIKNAPLLEELAEVERQISEGLRGDPLPEFAGKDPAKVWAGLKEAGNIERMRAIAALLLRVRIHPVRGKKTRAGWRPGMPHELDYDAVDILPPDA